MDNPEAKLQLAGDTLLLTHNNVDVFTLTYIVSEKRYHVEATKAFMNTPVTLDMAIANNPCKDGRQLHRQHPHEGLD